MKRVFNSLFLLVFVSTILSGCVSIESKQKARPDYPGHYTYELSGSYSDVWNALVKAVVEDMRFNVTSADKSKGLVKLKSELVPIGRYCDCGGYLGTAARGVSLRLKRLTAKKSSLTITARYYTEIELRNNLGQLVKKRKIDCPSTGRVEEEIVWNLRSRLED